MRRPGELRGSAPLLWSTGSGDEVWAMLVAARDGDARTLRRLLKKNPALAACHYNYRTPLYFAVRENRVAAAELLLEFMPDPLSLAVNETLLEVARNRGYTELERLLTGRLKAHGEPVAAAIRARNFRAFVKLLDARPELLHAHDERGNQPIHWAVMSRQIRFIDELLKRGADINAKRFDGARPLQLTNGDYLYRGWRDVTSKTRPREVLAHLRAKGAYCDICTACYIGDMERVRELLREDAGLANRPSEYVTYYACSGTPIRNAAAGGHVEIVRLLLAHGADPNLREEGIAPLGHALHMAVCNGHREIVELLLEHGAHPNVPVESSADTLSAAMRSEDPAMVKLLASRGAARSMELLGYYGDVVTAAAMLKANPKLADDPQALAYAAEEGHEPFVRLLLKYKPRLAARIAVGGKTREITELLFAHGMNPNHRDWLGSTPLHELARRGDIANAELFLEKGAKINAIDEDQRTTPLGWARKARQEAMAAFLEGRGATLAWPSLQDLTALRISDNVEAEGRTMP